MTDYIVFGLLLGVLALVVILLWKKRRRKSQEQVPLEDTWMDVYPEIPQDFS